MINFEAAKRAYTNRFTMEHVPTWALKRPCDCGGTAMWFYAPQYRTDREWFENTVFPPNQMCHDTDCFSTNPSWPLGKQLSAPYRRIP